MGTIVVLAAIVVATGSRADEPAAALVSDKAIESVLEPIREKHKVPGLIAAVVGPPGLTAIGVVGVRKLGSPEPMLVSDKIHIGSDTKAMTATRLAMLVEEGKLSWASTLGDVFADLKPQLHADFAGATLEQLLTHRAGLPANVNYAQFHTSSIVEQREALTKNVLGQAPQHPPGTKVLYSNVGYIVAGHLAERVTGKSWEELLTAGLFEPLGMSSAGFGVPGTIGQVDQPWGHRLVLGITAPMQLDNPAVLGPAGTVHCSFADWAKFVSLHLRAGLGEPSFLKPETFKKLHTPPTGERYAMGWGVGERPYIKGPLLIHAGSNTLWYATAAISPQHKIAFLAATNMGGNAGQQACDEALAALVAHQRLPR